MPGERLLNCKTAAEVIGKSESRLRHCWQVWGLTGYRVGGSLRFKESEIWEWLNGQKIAA